MSQPLTIRLTPAQTRFMRTFDSPSDLNLATRWEYKPDELQVARACAPKGLLNIVGAPPRARISRSR